MRVTIMLADSAQEVAGKLYVLGGGWSITGPQMPPSALVVKIDVPWDQANMAHHWRFELLDEDGEPVRVPDSPETIRVEGDFEVGRPPGLPPGTPIDVPLAINLGPLPLEPGRRYVWQFSIDGLLEEDWSREFLVRAAT